MNRRQALTKAIQALVSVPVLGWMGAKQSDLIINAVEPTYGPLVPDVGSSYPMRSYMMPVEIVSRSVRELSPGQYEVTAEWKIGETPMNPMKMRYTV